MSTEKHEDIVINFPKICIVVFVIYITLILSFHSLAGDQLHLRQSRGNLALPVAEAGTTELVQGTVIEQTFIPKIQRLKTVGVQWSTYYRANTGTVTLELYDTRDSSLLMHQTFDASAITEGFITTMETDVPFETLYDVPLLLRIYGNSQSGSAVTPLMASAVQEGWQLSINGNTLPGTLCFIAEGEDYIWTGLHYWEFAVVGAVLLAIFLGVVWYHYSKGKRSYVVNALVALQKYRFLIRQLVSRDFKTKYKRSILGMFWSFLNPLLTMIVQYFVFSTIFKSDIQNYPTYLLIGIVCFNFFSEACSMALTSILGNASLITKVYMPKYIYPLTRVVSSVVNLGISLIPLVIVAVVTGVQFQQSAVLAIFFLICLIIFSMGLGMLLSTSMVFFRDTQFLWGVFSMMWMYATPIFYPESILPDNFKVILEINPLYYFLKNTRMCILDGLSPEPSAYVGCFAMAIAMLLVGAFVFRKSQDRFVLYL